MNRALIILISIIFFIGCNTTPSSTKKDKSASDSLQKKKMIDSQMALGDRPDSEQEGPSFDEVKADLLSSYNKVGRIDTLVVIGSDTLHIHEKYYCLHDSSLIIPKKYLWGGDKSKDFVTHNFASKIVVVKNADTILNKIFKKSDFNSALQEEEKQHAILFDPGFEGYSQKYNGIVFGYSISIPLTDVGVPAYILVDKSGKYRILDEYAEIK